VAAICAFLLTSGLVNNAVINDQAEIKSVIDTWVAEVATLGQKYRRVTLEWRIASSQLHGSLACAPVKLAH
jgi:hypothetical protein